MTETYNDIINELSNNNHSYIFEDNVIIKAIKYFELKQDDETLNKLYDYLMNNDLIPIVYNYLTPKQKTSLILKLKINIEDIEMSKLDVKIEIKYHHKTISITIIFDSYYVTQYYCYN